MQAGFETLVEAGYKPESAYFEWQRVAKTVEIRKNSKQSHRADDQAKRWEKAQ